jgi:hypothetical protein
MNRTLLSIDTWVSTKSIGILKRDRLHLQRKVDSSNYIEMEAKERRGDDRETRDERQPRNEDESRSKTERKWDTIR